MLKRVMLFFLTNILVVITISLVLNVLGIGRYLTRYGIDYGALAAFCLVWGMGGAFISLGLSRLMAKWMMGVHVIDPGHPGEFGFLVDTVHGLAQKARLPAMPEVGVYDSPEVNAFATGPSRSRALVAVSTGLLQRMDRDQLEGVLGHEITHVSNGDMVTMTLIQGVINAFVMFFARILAFAISSSMRGRDSDRQSSFGGGWANYLLISVLEMAFGALGFLVIARFSRWREFRADHGGAEVAGRHKMISALQQLQRLYGRTPEVPGQTAVATLKISGKQGGWLSLMATHPPLEERIARLQASA